jgi:hypothetical protein
MQRSVGSDDFSITDGPQPLIVMRDGHSSNRACFSIRPVRSGRGILTAHLFKSGNFVQKLTIAVDVLAGSLDLVTPIQRQPLGVVSAGRPLASIGSLQPRNISITVDAKDDHFVLAVANGPRARLPFNVHELAGWIDEAQAALSEVVGWQRTGSRIEPYRAATGVSLADRDATLPILAEAGFRLYQHLFYDSPGAGADAAQVGDYLRNAVRSQRRLRLQFVSERYFWPWELLYVAEQFDSAEVHPEWLLGLSHIIEYMPERQTDVFLPPEINCDPLLNVGLNVNLDIDSAMGQAFVGEQLRYWAAREAQGGVAIVRRTKAAEVKDALANCALRDDLIYFYCHASAKQPPERSYLQLSNGGALTLADLKRDAPVRPDQRLVRAPLVILNACESADLSPVFYDGFLPYLIMRGVRAVIGTACNVPAVFAAAWARRFFDLLFAGTPLAELMLQLRQEFFNKHNNVLGLLYGLYGEGDTRLIPTSAVQDHVPPTS